MDADIRHMQTALALARRGLGNVWPNPAVGAVIVQGTRIVGRGWTQPGGRPHAETEALAQAARVAPGAVAGATLYVTLEPCAHHGQTPPCIDAIIQAGIGRVVYAVADPDPRVAGRGEAGLRKAGIAVTAGVSAAAAQQLNAGFFSRVQRDRPFVQCKIATTQDARIATVTGASQWITGEAARRYGHFCRAEADAIMTGSETVIADDPELSVRLPGLHGRSPVRVLMDRRLRCQAATKLAASAKQIPVWLFTYAGNPDQARILSQCGVRIFELVQAENEDSDGAFARDAMAALAGEGVTRLLVEAGRRLSTTLLRTGLVDELLWFRAPSVIGDDGTAGLGALGVRQLAEQIRLQRKKAVYLGEDLLEIFAVEPL